MLSLSSTAGAVNRPAEDRSAHAAPPVASICLRCLQCGADGELLSYQSLAAATEGIACERCSASLPRDEGIWRALPALRQAHFARFIREYQQVRHEEGRGSETAEFYLALPFRDPTGENSWQWSIRARTYRYVVRHILPTLQDNSPSALKILDLGAGNGWLSYRLASLGHLPFAVDLLTNPLDGLAAAAHYRSARAGLFPRFQADLDHLPFADEQFDCAIFNASFHYSENCERTLAESIRCLVPGGALIIADSPTYSDASHGEQMIVERREYFQEQYGFKSDGLNSCEYLTPERLIALEAQLDLEWRVHRVWYGFRWALRPVLARLRKRREPSQFVIYTAQVKQQ